MTPYLLATIIALSGAAQAQTIYRIEHPDGRITFSDRLPTNLSQGKVVSTGTGAQMVASSANLPFELKQTVAKYPVTLYSAPQCAPCESGRAQLVARGIPFSERSVATAEDSAQLQRISGDATLPFMTIGSQRVKGFSAPEWTQYLDAAGYPATSMLPAGYKNAPATPLAPIPVAPTSKAPAKETPAPPAANTSNDNPAGITF